MESTCFLSTWPLSASLDFKWVWGESILTPFWDAKVKEYKMKKQVFLGLAKRSSLLKKKK